MPVQLLETHIEVSDLEKSVALYSALIPHTRVERWGDDETGRAAALILEGGEAFGLWEEGKIGIHGGRAGKHLHFAFQIAPEEYDRYVALIRAEGLEPLEHVWERGAKSVYFFDDDGHQGEFITANWHDLS
jgi:catechol 2,3-dioxygenase-like lactoylglutathione lyase family enzyme